MKATTQDVSAHVGAAAWEQALAKVTVHPPDAFYRPPTQVPDKPGALLRSEQLKDVTLPAGMQGWRILYTTTVNDSTPATAVATGLKHTQLKCLIFRSASIRRVVCHGVPFAPEQTLRDRVNTQLGNLSARSIAWKRDCLRIPPSAPGQARVKRILTLALHGLCCRID